MPIFFGLCLFLGSPFARGATENELPTLNWESLACRSKLTADKQSLKTFSRPQFSAPTESLILAWETFAKDYAQNRAQSIKALGEKIKLPAHFEISSTHQINEVKATERWQKFLNLHRLLKDAVKSKSEDQIIRTTSFAVHEIDAFLKFVREGQDPSEVLGLNITRVLLDDLTPVIVAIERFPNHQTLIVDINLRYQMIHEQIVASALYVLTHSFSPTLRPLMLSLFFNTSSKLDRIDSVPSITLLKDPDTLNLIAPSLPALAQVITEWIPLGDSLFSGIYADYVYHQRHKWRLVGESKSPLEKTLFEFVRTRMLSRIENLEKMNRDRMPYLVKLCDEYRVKLASLNWDLGDPRLQGKAISQDTFTHIVQSTPSMIDDDPIISSLLSPDRNLDPFVGFLDRALTDHEVEPLMYVARLYARLIYDAQQSVVAHESGIAQSRAHQFIMDIYGQD